MLVIRPEQTRALQASGASSFEDALVGHLRGFSPRHSEVLGENGLRQVVRYGMRRAQSHGLTSAGPVRFFIELMAMFGCDFDTDVQTPWATHVLEDTLLTDQNVKAERLHEQLTLYLDRVAGPRNAFAIEALRRAAQVRLEDFPRSGPAFESNLLGTLHGIYPEKCEFLGPERLQALTREATEQASAQSIDDNRGVALVVGLMFTAGHGALHDPQHPWIMASLSRNAPGDPAIRIERLYMRTMTYLREVLARLGP